MFRLTPGCGSSPTRSGFSVSSACTSEALDYSISVISASELAEAIWATLERRDGAKLFPKDLRNGLTDGRPESFEISRTCGKEGLDLVHLDHKWDLSPL